MTEPVLYDSRDGVAVLTLNRPEVLNALDYALIDRLMAALDRIEADDGIRAVLLAGGPFPAARALEIGLVNRVVPHTELLPAPLTLAGRIVRHSPLAVAAVIAAATRGLNMAIAEGLQAEAEQFARMAPTADLREGLDAWTSRRAPVFTGR